MVSRIDWTGVAVWAAAGLTGLVWLAFLLSAGYSLMGLVGLR